MTTTGFSLFPARSDTRTRGPFIGDQRLLWLQTEEHVEPRIKKECFRAGLENATDSQRSGSMPKGCRWVPVTSAPVEMSFDDANERRRLSQAKRDREEFFRSLEHPRMCLMIESGVGKSMAMQQVLHLRSTNPGHLVIGFEFAEIPIASGEDSLSRFRSFLRENVKQSAGISQRYIGSLNRLLARKLLDGHCTLVIDGLDQTDSAVVCEQITLLMSFLAEYPLAACVVAGRPYSVTGEFWDAFLARDTRWQFVEIQEFEPDQQERYVSKESFHRLKLIEVAALAQPRLLESVRGLEPHELDGIRTGSELHWRVIRDAFHKSREKRLDHNSPSQQETFRLLALVAFVMLKTRRYSRVLVNDYQAFLYDIFDYLQTLGPGDVFRRHYGDDQRKAIQYLKEDLGQLARQNAELKFAFLHQSELADIRFRSRTIQDFFAAYWLARHRCSRGEQDWLANNTDHHSQPDRPLTEFWRLLTQMPSPASTGHAEGGASIDWVRSVAPLFERPGSLSCRRRSTEMIYRAWWGLLETAGRLDRDPRATEHDMMDATKALQAEVGERDAIRSAVWPPENPNVETSAGLADSLLQRFVSEFPAIYFGKQIPNSVDKPREWARWFWDPSLHSGFVTIPKGKFPMGMERDERAPAHIDEISTEFQLHRQPLVNACFQLFDPSHAGAGTISPLGAAHGLSWYDAWGCSVWFHGWLPSEQQWERACRGRLTGLERTRFWSGNRESDLHRVAFHDDDFRPAPPDVLRGDLETTEINKPANGLGVFHVHGMVREWTASWDCGHPSMGKREVSPSYRSTRRILRGGSHEFYSSNCSTHFRDRVAPDIGDLDFGCRIARSLNLTFFEK